MRTDTIRFGSFLMAELFSFFNEKTQSLEPRLEKNSGDNRPLPYFSKYFIDSKKDVSVTGLHNITFVEFQDRISDIAT